MSILNIIKNWLLPKQTEEYVKGEVSCTNCRHFKYSVHHYDGISIYGEEVSMTTYGQGCNMNVFTIYGTNGEYSYGGNDVHFNKQECESIFRRQAAGCDYYDVGLMGPRVAEIYKRRFF